MKKQQLRPADGLPRTDVAGHATETAVARLLCGPLPTAEEAASYEGLLSGAFDRILTTAEQEAEHQRALELKNLDSRLRWEQRAQWTAFVFAVVGILVGTLLVIVGYPLEGLVALLAAPAVLAGVLFRQWRQQDLSSSKSWPDTSATKSSLPKSSRPTGNGPESSGND